MSSTRSKAKKSKLMPLYHATKSLDMTYTFEPEELKISVLEAETHATLYDGYRGILHTRSEMQHKTGKKMYAAVDKSMNFATGAVILLFADTSKKEGYLGSIEQHHITIPDSSKRIWAPGDLSSYTLATPHAKNSTPFKQSLTDRITAFTEVSDQYESQTEMLSTTKTFATAKGMYEQKFHHTEQAIMHDLSSAAFIKYLVKEALKSKAEFVFGVVLDIFTQRAMCCNCNACLLGMQHSHTQGFLADFSAALKKSKIQPREDHPLMLSTRVSAAQGLAEVKGTLDDKNIVHTYDPDHSNKVFQAPIESLGINATYNKKGASFKKFKGALFVSDAAFTKNSARLQDKIELPAATSTTGEYKKPGHG